MDGDSLKPHFSIAPSVIIYLSVPSPTAPWQVNGSQGLQIEERIIVSFNERYSLSNIHAWHLWAKAPPAALPPPDVRPSFRTSMHEEELELDCVLLEVSPGSKQAEL